MSEKLYQPSELAKICGIKLSTLNGYLRDTELFPPIEVDNDNGYRYYGEMTVKDLGFFKKLRKKPFSLKINAAKTVMIKLGSQSRANLMEKNNTEIFNYLEQNNLW